MNGLSLIYNKRMNLWIKIRNLIYRLNDFDLHNNENCSFEIKAKHIKKNIASDFRHVFLEDQ